MLRRDVLTILTAGTAGAAIARTLPFATPAAAQSAGPFTLPPLGYAYDALEPHIDTLTMTIHHQRHHQAYLSNLNAIVDKVPGLAEVAGKPAEIDKLLFDLDKVPDAMRTPVRNNLGGHWNHAFFWDLMTPGGAKEPKGKLKSAIDAAFGSQQAMAETFNAAAGARFGSGWAWLIVDKGKKLDIVSTANQDPPHTLGARGIVGVDVWEHAYYLKYQNRRPDYVKAWWNTVNWDKAEANFNAAA